MSDSISKYEEKQINVVDPTRHARLIPIGLDGTEEKKRKHKRRKLKGRVIHPEDKKDRRDDGDGSGKEEGDRRKLGEGTVYGNFGTPRSEDFYYEKNTRRNRRRNKRRK